MNLNWYSCYNSLGYGIASKNFLRELSKNHNVAYFPIGQISLEQEHEKPLVQKLLDNRNFYDGNAPCIRMWHQNQLAETIGRGPKIAFPFFELNKFSTLEKHHLLQQDKILVASKWAKTIIEQNGIDVPVFVVPLGVDTTIFKDGMTRKKTDITRFLNVGKWELRKGHDVIVEAFNRAFTKDDNVELTMACHNPFLSEIQTKEWHDLYKNSCLGSKINIVESRLDTQHQLAALINGHDVGVFPARAEGWNLDLLECMAMGLSVIATNYSGHTEFCTDTNTHLIECPNLETAFDGIWFHGQGEWAEVAEDEIEQMVVHMRALYKLRKEQGDCYNIAGHETGRKFSWTNSANALVSTLEK
jgi:glycosyltransferase involved in cell wall biosynthesis